MATGADPSSNRGWTSVRRRKTSKRPRRRVDDNGTPLIDEMLLCIFACLPAIADLVRCAATCKRWRRLVAGNAAFLCRTARVPGGGQWFQRPLALGLFYNHTYEEAPPRFIAMAPSTTRRFFGLHHLRKPLPPLASLIDGLDRTSHVVASRNGLVVVDCRRGERDEALALCVCNPVSGDVRMLPSLAGKDGVGCRQYACAVITADDRDDDVTGSNSASDGNYFRVVVVYRRQGFTAFRSYSSDEGVWSLEAKVSGAGLSDGKKMGNGLVARGGRAVYWQANKGRVFALRLDTLEAATADLVLPTPDAKDVLLGLTPQGTLCAVWLHLWSVWEYRTCTWQCTLRILSSGSYGHGGNVDDIKLQVDRLQRDETRKEVWVGHFSTDNFIEGKLRWVCEKSGVVFFSARETHGHPADLHEMYALRLDAATVETVTTWVGDSPDRDPWRDLHGYEMNQQAYLESLAERPCTEDVTKNASWDPIDDHEHHLLSLPPPSRLLFPTIIRSMYKGVQGIKYPIKYG